MKQRSCSNGHRLVRPTILLAAIAASCSSFAQSANDVQNAFRRFAASGNLKMTLTGHEYSNGLRQSIRSDAAYLQATDSNGRLAAMVEVVSYLDGILLHRAAADGKTLWGWNPRLREYTAIDYSGLGSSGQRAHFGPLTDGLGSIVSGPGAHLVRILRDVLHNADTAGPNGAIFRSWTPGFSPQFVTEASGSVVDPVNPNRRYVADPTRYFVLYCNGAAPTKSLAFEFASGAGGRGSYELAFAYYSENASLSGRTKFTDFQIEFLTGASYPAGQFVFVPPPNARAISPSKNGG